MDIAQFLTHSQTTGSDKMGIKSLMAPCEPPSSPPRPSTEPGISIRFRPISVPQTPPASDPSSPAQSPHLPLTPCTNVSPKSSPLPSIAQISSPANQAFRLPSLQEFDQGVEALARTHGSIHVPSCPQTPLPSLSYSAPVQHHHYHSHQQCQQQQQQQQQQLPPLHSYTPYDPYQGFPMGDFYDTGIEGYPSPPLDGENRHINQKYTTEQGDFIIYAWHDKKMKWQRIKQDFASMFGVKPKRTVQGLQAWYYRMNQRIPLWDKDGWLIFENDEDLEPKQISIKCRESNESLGLAERYPERAIQYSWVDPELKRKARDWAARRNMQYNERERRRRKEQRRLKL